MNLKSAVSILRKSLLAAATLLVTIETMAAARSMRLILHVADDETSEPLECAFIKVVSETDSTLTVTGITDTNGNFPITFSEAEGRKRIDISIVGYKPERHIINSVPATSTDTLRLQLRRLDALSEVVVTARESRHATSTSTIDRSAMGHLQPSSFTDLLQLLPGGVTVDPQMGQANTIALRQAQNITATDNDYNTQALGTAFIIDGVPLNVGSEMQSTPVSEQEPRTTVGKGVDMRSLSTDDIERVEIIRGIPGVEYGEVTSGVVNIVKKMGKSPLEARFKADTQSQLFYLGKGLDIGRKEWLLNFGIDYLDSKIDPRNNRENFKRVNATLRSNRRFAFDQGTLTWNSSLSYGSTFERDYNDPDLTVNNTIDYYSSTRRLLTWNNTLSFRRTIDGFFREASLTTGLSYADEDLTQRRHVASSRVMPVPVSLTEGSNYVGYLPMLYLAEMQVDGRPFSVYAKARAATQFSTASTVSRLNAGAEWEMNKNYGHGQLYDLTRPLIAGNNSRPRPFSDIPAMHRVAGYIQYDFRLYAGRSTLNVVGGLRATSLLHLSSRYALAGRVYLDPRVNAILDLPAPTIAGHRLNIELAAGAGLHTKMPVASYLYPDKIYSDFEQLNYFHNNPAYRTMNVATFIDDFTNYDLRAARNFKWETRFDLTYRGNRLSVTYFRERMLDGFRQSTMVRRYVYNRYDASEFDAESAGRAPRIDELPFTPTVNQAIRRKITNGSATIKEGIEYTFQTPRFQHLATRLTVNGAYFVTTNRNSQPLWYKPSIIVNNRELQYVGLYDDMDGSEYTSFNTNFMLDTEVKKLSLNFSLTVQNVWFTTRRTLRRDGIPVSYLDPEGQLHPFDATSSSDPYLKQLIREFTDASFERITVPAATTFNLKATKQLWGGRAGLAVYVNRLLAIEPSYRRNGLLIRRYSTPYFGMELNIRI